MIEFLSPRDGAFGESDTPDFVGFDGDATDDFGDEPQRSRWLTALAVIGVTGLLAGGVIAAAPWDNDPAATPTTTTTPTTTPPPTTAPRTTTTTEPGLPPGVSADIPGMLPAGPTPYVLSWAQSIARQFEGNTFGDPIEVWMSPDASRGTGRWIIVDATVNDGGYQRLRRNAVRVDAGTRPAQFIEHPDGVVEIEVRPPAVDGGLFSVFGFGLGLPELIRVASTVRVDASEIDMGDLLAPGGPFDGLGQRAADDIAWIPGGFSNSAADAISQFADESGTGIWIQVSVDSADPTTQLLDELIGLTRVQPSTLSLRGLAGLYSLSERFDSVAVARSDVVVGLKVVRFALTDGRIVTVIGQVDIDELLAFAGQLELATLQEWEAAIIDTFDSGNFPQGGPQVDVKVGGPPLSDWQAYVYASLASVQLNISGPNFYVSESLDQALGPRLTVYRSIDRAFLVVTNTWPDPGRRVVITQPGLEPNEVPLVPVDDTALHALVVELDASLPYDVFWLDRWGAPAPGPAQAGS